LSLSPVDTRAFFRPLSADIVQLLRSLPADAWERPTVAGAWRVRDVVAHLADTALRRVSIQRDGHAVRGLGPDPSEREILAFVNDLNAQWVRVAARFSPRVLTDIYALAGRALADVVERARLDEPAVFPVSWAGESQSAAWLDIGREFTEVWHHGAQIRDAVGAAPFADARWLAAVIAIALHALPHAYRDVPGGAGAAIAIEISGAAGGAWTLRHDGRWVVDEGVSRDAAARATMNDDTAWRLFFNALPAEEAAKRVRIDGDRALAGPLLRTRSVIV
jgi:uncharacterized protein (TIGR03083 family)